MNTNITGRSTRKPGRRRWYASRQDVTSNGSVRSVRLCGWLAFTRTERRTQRLSDGTAVIEAHRFEVPNCYRHLTRLLARYASWDLARVHLVGGR